jgi:hypothetical protein
MARRAGALIVAVFLVVGSVLVLKAVAGGADDDASGAGDSIGPAATTGGEPSGTTGATSAPASVGPTDDTTAPTDAQSGTAETTTTLPPSTEPERKGPPTADDPALVYIAGDSDAGTFGPYLDTLLSETGVADIELDYKVSSGLSRPDFFNWPERFAETLPAFEPEIVVVTFGGNDAQGLADVSGEFIVGGPTDDTKDWKKEYSRRVGEVMDLLSADGRTLVWVGIPNDNNPDVTARMKVQDDVVRNQAADRPDVIFIDTWRRFSGRSGNWAEYVIDPRDGQGKDVRADDGFHLNENGAEILALDIAEAVRADLRHRGAAI